MATFYVLVLVLGICVRISWLVKGGLPGEQEDHEPWAFGLPGSGGECSQARIRGNGVGRAKGGDTGSSQPQRSARLAEGLVVFGLVGLIGALFTPGGRESVVFLLAAVISVAAIGSKRLRGSRQTR